MGIEILIILTLILLATVIANIGLLYYSYDSNSTQSKILAILQDLQDVTNLDIPKETAASLVDIGNKINKEGALDNISRSNNLWEEDSLEGEEIEDIYAR